LKSRKRPVGLDPATFMRRHWQREPLLLRGAFPGLRDPLSPREVMALSEALDDRRGAVCSLGSAQG